MADESVDIINFDCPECGQNLDAPSEYRGREVPCPSCGATIRVPDPDHEQHDVHETEPAQEESAGKDETGLQDLPEDELKGSTVQIDLPEDLGLPKPKSRVFKIKRRGK